MRILIIIDGLSGGGAEKAVLTLAQGFISINQQVSIFSLRDVCDYKIPDGVEYQIIPDKSHFPWKKVTEIFRRSRALDKAINKSQQRNGKFCIIFSNLHKTDRIVARSRILLPERVWFCLHTMFSFGYLKHRFIFSFWLKRYKIYKIYNNRNLIAVSHNVLKDMCQVFKVIPRQAHIIYNAFDFIKIRKLAQEPCELIDQHYLIHVSRLHKNKRQDRLLKSYAKSGICVPLVILGKGNDNILRDLKLLAQNLGVLDRVIFKDFTINPYPYIYNADMLILSSDSEGFGNVIIEALICKVPVVSTRCPGGPEEILCGDLAVGLAELNSSSLAKTIKKVYKHPPIINSNYLKKYNISVICQKYISLIRKIDI